MGATYWHHSRTLGCYGGQLGSWLGCQKACHMWYGRETQKWLKLLK